MLALTTLLSGCTYPGWQTPGVDTPVRSAFRFEPVHENLSFPVSMAFAPDGRLFFTEKFDGGVRVIENGTLLSKPFAAETVASRGEGGMLGLALHPDFERQPWVYASFTVDDGDLMEVKVVRYLAHSNAASTREVIVDGIPGNRHHAGGILEFGPDGMLYLSGGDADHVFRAMLSWTPYGKIHRFTPEGEIPDDNPAGESSTYSRGHRNVFGLAFHPDTQVLYATENGPEEGDELNRILPGKNYGWPAAVGPSWVPWYEDPLLTFSPTIAPTEAEFYTGDAYGPEYDHNLFFGSFKNSGLHRVVLDGDNGTIVTHELVFNEHPVIDVENGPDGHLYVATPSSIGRLVPIPAE